MINGFGSPGRVRSPRIAAPNPRPYTAAMLALATVVLYLAALVSVGVVKSRKVEGQSGFALAGRSLGPLVLVGTLLATWTGTGSIFGNAEEAYGVGLPALVLPLASATGVLVLLVMIPRVRAKGRYTLQDVLEERFGVTARVLGTITLVMAYLVIVSYQLRAAAGLLDRVLVEAGVVESGMGESAALVIVAAFVALYTALAGLMSVAVTDGINGLLMLLGVAIALPLVWSAAGGTDEILAALPESGRQFGGHYSTFDILSILLPGFLLVVGDANLHQRFLAARSDASARRAAWLLIPGILLVDGLILLLAMAGRAQLPELANPGHVVLEVALQVLPEALGALLIAAILAIIVSTADSFLLSSSSALVRDVYQRFMNRGASEAQLLRVSRVAVCALAAVGLWLAFDDSGFFEIALYAYTIYGVGITPVLLAALFWKRATPAGAVASMVVGVGTAVAWKANEWSEPAAQWLGQPEGSGVGAVVPSVLVACVVLVGVSLCTRVKAAG